MNAPKIIRRSILLTATALLLLAAVRLSFLDGLLRRVSIDGPSMAPAFCGPHYCVTCHDCAFHFPCDAEHLPADGRAACPNCGYTENAIDDAQFTPPDRVFIDRWPLLWASPRRGNVVAVALAGSADIAIKRIAGLPGERPSIADGDLFAKENIIRKTAADLHNVRLLVHDNDFQPHLLRDLPDLSPFAPRKGAPRWRPAEKHSLWQETARGFRIDPPTADHDAYDWLQYEHWKCTADPKTRGIAAPITDNDSYNQGETRRPLNVVTDVLLSCRLRASGSGTLVLAADACGQRFEAEIEPQTEVALRKGDQIVAEKRLKKSFANRFIRVEFGLCDQQVLLVIDSQTIFRHPYQPTTSSKTKPLHPLAIGAHGIHLELTNLRVWHDLYYLDPQGLPRPWHMPKVLGSDEYAVLGDNQPVSLDSRQWQPPGVPRIAILGHVYHPFWASRRLD